MKKVLVGLTILAVLTGTALAVDRYTPGRNSAKDAFQGVVPIQGIPRSAPGVVYIDNTARTIQSLFERAGGTYLGGGDNTMAPISALIECPTVAVRYGFNVTPTTTVGTYVPAGSSWILPGPQWVSGGKAIAAGATDNAACSIVLSY